MASERAKKTQFYSNNNKTKNTVSYKQLSYKDKYNAVI